MDVVDLTKEIEKFNRETIPLLNAIVKQFLDGIGNSIERLNGAEIVITVKFPDK